MAVVPAILLFLASSEQLERTILQGLTLGQELPYVLVLVEYVSVEKLEIDTLFS